MKPLVVILFTLLFVACSKQMPDQPFQQNNVATTAGIKKPQACDFGIRDFNLSKRAPIYDGFSGVEKGTETEGGQRKPCIYLDFDGQVVTNNNWTFGNGPITCAPANLSPADINLIYQKVSIDYSPFNIDVTLNESVYNSAPVAKRMRVIITESWEWYGQAGGVSQIGSFTWGDDTPCFVFSSLLNYNVKSISEASTHESGHTFGLYHQSAYDANCNKVNEYNYGQGTGETGWAPIMGCGYSKNLTLWNNGPNPYGCSVLQSDVSIISGITGMRSDDYPNTTKNAPSLSTQLQGLINSTTDIDYFKLTLTSSKNISLAPLNTGPGNESGNVDMVMKVYNSQGSLINAIDDPMALGASIVLAPGTYYVSANSIANPNAGTYGMIGGYTISAN